MYDLTNPSTGNSFKLQLEVYQFLLSAEFDPDATPRHVIPSPRHVGFLTLIGDRFAVSIESCLYAVPEHCLESARLALRLSSLRGAYGTISIYRDPAGTLSLGLLQELQLPSLT